MPINVHGKRDTQMSCITYFLQPWYVCMYMSVCTYVCIYIYIYIYMLLGLGKQVVSTQNKLGGNMVPISYSICATQNLLVLLNSTWTSGYMMTL